MTSAFDVDDDGEDFVIKDPLDVLDYTVNFDKPGDSWLAGDTIAGTPVCTVPSGLTNPSPAQSNTTTTVTVWVGGGTHQQSYKVSVYITTAAGRKLKKSFRVQVENQ